MAIFVTFEDKLGYTLSAICAMQCEGGILPCKIKTLKGCEQGDCWHLICKLVNEVQG